MPTQLLETEFPPYDKGIEKGNRVFINLVYPGYSNI